MVSTLRISRQQLAAFLKNDHDAIRQFETLFNTVANPDPTATATEPEIVVETAAHEALARIERLERALQMMELGPSRYDLSISDVVGLQSELDSKMSPSPTYTFFDPDKPPDSPSSMDDEFDGTSLDAKWTTVNWASASVKDVNTTVPGCLYMQSNNIGYVIPTILQSLPSGDFTIATKVQNQSEAASNSNVGGGLVLTDGVTAGAGIQQVFVTRTYSYGQTWLLKWATFSSSGTPVIFARTEQALYLRLRRSGTTYYWGTSWNGKTWTDQAFTPAVTPTHCGLLQYCNQTADGHTSFEFFRYFPSASAVIGGNRTFYST